MRTARKGMNYVSAELMRARDAAGYSSYCERLYIEGLEELEKKKRLVRRAAATCPVLRVPLPRCSTSSNKIAPRKVCSGLQHSSSSSQYLYLQTSG